MGNGWLDEIFTEYEADPEYVAIYLSLEVCESMLQIMSDESISKIELARRMGVSRANASRLFEVRYPMTLRTVAKLAVALGAKVTIRAERQKESEHG